MNLKHENKYISTDTILWKFPRDINFINTTGYINSIDTLDYQSDITFDLYETETLH